MQDDEQKMSATAFAARVASEGGIIQALNAGLRSQDLDDLDSALAQAWSDLEFFYASRVVPALEYINSLMTEALAEESSN